MNKNIFYKTLLILFISGFILSCSDDYLDSSRYFKDRLTEEKVFESKVYSEEWLANIYEELKGINADVASKAVTPHNFADDMYYVGNPILNTLDVQLDRR